MTTNMNKVFLKFTTEEDKINITDFIEFCRRLSTEERQSHLKAFFDDGNISLEEYLLISKIVDNPNCKYEFVCSGKSLDNITAFSMSITYFKGSVVSFNAMQFMFNPSDKQPQYSIGVDPLNGQDIGWHRYMSIFEINARYLIVEKSCFTFNDMLSFGNYVYTGCFDLEISEHIKESLKDWINEKDKTSKC